MLENIMTILNQDENNKLLQEIAEEENYLVVWSLEQDKAPSLDGFSIHFFRFFLGHNQI
jgi:hypothetical protein